MSVDIRKGLKRFSPHLLKAQEENSNEANTKICLLDFFEDVLGYNKRTEITAEMQIKDKYVDFGVKMGGEIRFLVEAKAAGVNLHDSQIDQAKLYAAEANISWVLLTNGVEWKLYHLSFGEGIKSDYAFVVDLSSDPIKVAAERLSLLHRQSIQKGELDTFWEHRIALSHESITDALFSWEVLSKIRAKIHQKNILTDIEDLTNEIYNMLSQEIRDKISRPSPPKRKIKRYPKKEIVKENEGKTEIEF